MENKRKGRPVESGLTYEAPRVEVFEVNVERGFEGSSLIEAQSSSYPNWETETEDW
jgi:hypothetical protein